MLRFNFAVLAAALSLLAFVQSASAANYCVGASPDCTGSPNPNYPADSTGITDAISDAKASGSPADVYLAAGAYSIDTDTFDRSAGAGANSLNIIGAGRGQTVLNLVGAGSVEQMYLALPTATSRMSGFTLNVTANATFQTGLYLRSGIASDFAVNLSAVGSPPNYTTTMGIHGGSSIDHATLTTTVGGLQPYGLVVDGPGAVAISDVSVAGTGVADSYGLKSYVNPTTSISRLRISGYGKSIWVVDGTLNLSDSVIDMGSITSAEGVLLKKIGGTSTNIAATLTRNTFVGNGDDQVGIDAFTTSPNTLGLWLNDTVVFSAGSGTIGARCVGVDTQAFLTRFVYSGGLNGCIDWEETDATAITSSPFKDFAGGDLRPAWNSPLVDSGSTTGDVGSGDVDIAGRPRLVGSAVDIGAFEYQHSAPVVSIQASNSTPTVSEVTSFTAAASDADGESLTYAWTIDGAASSEAGSVLSGGFTAAGNHTVAVTVTDESGQSASASSTVTVRSSCPAVTYAAMKVKTKPKSAFKRKGKGFAVASSKQKQPYFALSGAKGDFVFTLQSLSKSKKLTKLAGSQTVKLKKGANKLTFGGKWNKKPLKAGTYKLSVAPKANGSCPVPTLATVTFKLK